MKSPVSKSFRLSESFFRTLLFGVFILIILSGSLKYLAFQAQVSQTQFNQYYFNTSQLLVAHAHRIKNDAFLSQNIQWNLQNAVNTYLQKEVVTQQLDRIQIIDHECRVIGSSNVAFTEKADCSDLNARLTTPKLERKKVSDGKPSSLIVTLPMEHKLILRAEVVLTQDGPTLQNIFMQNLRYRETYYEILLLTLLFAGLLIFYGKIVLKSRSLMRYRLQFLEEKVDQLSAETQNKDIKIGSLQAEVLSLNNQSEKLTSEALALRKDIKRLQTHQMMSFQFKRSYQSLRSKIQTQTEGIQETLNSLQSSSAATAKKLFVLLDSWVEGVKCEASKELGIRKFFKRISEEVDPAANKSRLESDLSQMMSLMHDMNDEIVHSSLQLSALKHSANQHLSFFDHWNQLLNIEHHDSNCDVLLSYRKITALLKLDADFAKIKLLPPTLVSRQGFENPKVSEPVLTSLFYHVLQYLVLVTAETQEERVFHPILKVAASEKSRMNKFEIYCSTQKGLRIKPLGIQAKEQISFILSLLEGSGIQIEPLQTGSGSNQDQCFISLNWEGKKVNQRSNLTRVKQGVFEGSAPPPASSH